MIFSYIVFPQIILLLSKVFFPYYVHHHNSQIILLEPIEASEINVVNFYIQSLAKYIRIGHTISAMLFALCKIIPQNTADYIDESLEIFPLFSPTVLCNL